MVLKVSSATLTEVCASASDGGTSKPVRSIREDEVLTPGLLKAVMLQVAHLVHDSVPFALMFGWLAVAHGPVHASESSD